MPKKRSGMKWITREKIKVDRVACPWLIRNFVDSEAEFVFLPPETEWEKIDNGTVFKFRTVSWDITARISPSIPS